MESLWNNYYIVMKKSLLLSGQWPYLKKREKLIRVTILIISEISILVTQVGNFIQCGKDIHCHLMAIPMFLIYFTIMIKIITCYVYNNKIKYLTDQLCNNWKIFKNPIESEIMKTYAAKGKSISLIYATYYFAGVPIYLSISFVPKILDIVRPLNESRPIIMPQEAYYFVKDEREYFYYIYFHTLIAAGIVIVIVVAHDCTILTYIEHVCGIFAVAGHRFETLGNNPDVKNNKDNVYNKKIALAVYAHWRALEFAKVLENTFSITLIIQMLMVLLGMSVTLLEMAVHLESPLEMMKSAASVTGQMIHIFCFSLQGQKLIDHSLQVQDKIYNCTWYKIPVKSQRQLINVMRRSLQPNTLSAGGMYIFSLKSFMTVIQSSVSYFTVLSSFQ